VAHSAIAVGAAWQGASFARRGPDLRLPESGRRLAGAALEELHEVPGFVETQPSQAREKSKRCIWPGRGNSQSLARSSSGSKWIKQLKA
jgi:hypothetical protein